MDKKLGYNTSNKMKYLRARRRFYSRLRECDSEYKRLLELFPEAIVILSNMKVLFINARAKKLFKIEEGIEHSKINVLKHIPYDDVVKLKHNCYNIQASKNSLEFTQLELVDENEKVLYVEMGAMYIKYEGVDSVLAIIRDISRIKRETLMVAELNVELQKYINENDLLLYELRRFKHNERNMLQGLTGFIEENDINGLKSYLNKILKQVENSGSYGNLPVFKLKNASLRSLIYSKIQKAKELEIAIMFELEKDLLIDEKYISELELCEVIGIYLDNAIEAAEESKDKRIDILLFENKEYISMIIRNSMNTIKDNSQPFTSVSSKGVGRGSGLNYSRTILAKYDHIFSNSFTEYGYWTQEIHIKK